MRNRDADHFSPLPKRDRLAYLRSVAEDGGEALNAEINVTPMIDVLLVLHGTPGDSLGNLASWAHWLSALALTPLVLRHAWRWTILTWRT